jgi:sugar/nucleoside kinase (ribokinase family)
VANPKARHLLLLLGRRQLVKGRQVPTADNGAEFYNIDESIAADGAMAAAMLASLGQPSLLLTNNVGDDGSGAHVLNWLRDYGATTTAQMVGGHPTPQVVIVGDNHHTRTFFPYLPGVGPTSWKASTWSHWPVRRRVHRQVHLHCQSGVLGDTGSQGGRNPAAAEHWRDTPSEVFDALRRYPRLIVQTSLSEASAPEAQRLAGHLQDATRAEWAVITTGAAGAVAVSGRKRLSVPAFRADVLHAHCAGAAFSGGLIYGLLHDWPMQDCIDLPMQAAHRAASECTTIPCRRWANCGSSWVRGSV